MALWVSGQLGAWSLLPLTSAPLGVWLTQRLFTLHGKALNETLVATAKLLLCFGVLFALGIVLDARSGR